MRTVFLTLAVVLLGALALAPAASAHPERTTFFPDHTKGERPSYRKTGPSLVVCKPDSMQRVRQIYAGRGPKNTRKRRLRAKQMRRCRFEHIQAAVDAAKTNDRILILPGLYREEPSRAVPFVDRRCPFEDNRLWEETNDGHGEGNERAVGSSGKVPRYEYHVRCRNSRNLIQVLGDSVEDPDRECDQKCNLQIEGLGRRPTDVVVEGDRIKKDVIRADRADGFYIKNLTVEQAAFNGLDVVETNGFLIKQLEARWNQNYGVLTFTSDNGLYEDIDAFGNGDSGIYPGSGPEGHCQRFGIEIRDVRSYGNIMGQSGTAGNGTWVHDSKFYGNSAGIINDSFVTGHPGMPQDCSKWTDNEIYSNNLDLYGDDREAYCNSTPFEKRRREYVCPKFQVPIGTGFGFYGANGNILENNRIWDNWRSGYRLFWVPAAVRGENDPAKQSDTSNGNRIQRNVFGIDREGRPDPNGQDVFWDEQGVGNCWQNNRTAAGVGMTSDPPELPNCRFGGSRTQSSDPSKAAPEVTCSTWDPKDNPNPPGCTWFTVPSEPQPQRR